MKAIKRIGIVSAVSALAFGLAGCTIATRGNSESERVGAIDSATSETARRMGSGGAPAGGTTSSTLSGPNNVGGTIGSGNGSAIGTGTRTGAAGAGVPMPEGGR